MLKTKRLGGSGRTYTDMVVRTETGEMPVGDCKEVCHDYAVSYIGGNAVTALAFCARHGVPVDLLCQKGTDRTGKACHDALAELGVNVYGATIDKSPVSFIHASDSGERAMLRCRERHNHENEEWIDFPHIDVTEYGAFHCDGHFPNVALDYVQRCRKAGILTSLDGGGIRNNTDELLGFIDVAVVCRRMCEQMDKNTEAMLRYLRSKGCMIGGVTLGADGMYWYEGSGEIQHLPALNVPSAAVRDGTGCGDFFHGGYLYSYLTRQCAGWREHFNFARRVATNKLRFRGNEQCIVASSLEDIVEYTRRFEALPERSITLAA